MICCAFQIRSSQLPQALPPSELALGFFSGGYYPLNSFYSFQCTFCAFQVLKFDFVWIAVYSCIENSIGIKMCRKAPVARVPCRWSWRCLVSSGGVCTPPSAWCQRFRLLVHVHTRLHVHTALCRALFSFLNSGVVYTALSTQMSFYTCIQPRTPPPR